MWRFLQSNSLFHTSSWPFWESIFWLQIYHVESTWRMQLLTEAQYGHWGTPLKIRGWVPPFHKWMNHMSSRVKTAPTTPHRISIEQRLKRWLYFWGLDISKAGFVRRSVPKNQPRGWGLGGWIGLDFLRENHQPKVCIVRGFMEFYSPRKLTYHPLKVNGWFRWYFLLK